MYNFEPPDPPTIEWEKDSIVVFSEECNQFIFYKNKETLEGVKYGTDLLEELEDESEKIITDHECIYELYEFSKLLKEKSYYNDKYFQTQLTDFK